MGDCCEEDGMIALQFLVMSFLQNETVPPNLNFLSVQFFFLNDMIMMSYKAGWRHEGSPGTS